MHKTRCSVSLFDPCRPLPLYLSVAPAAGTPFARASRKEDPCMKCEVCGNDYDKTFTVILGGEQHTFDSFECAIHALAPTCAHCGCHIVGHGVEQGDKFFCCANCAKQAGVSGLIDRHDGRPKRSRKD